MILGLLCLKTSEHGPEWQMVLLPSDTGLEAKIKNDVPHTITSFE
jgi:hypothetical protein